MESRKYTNFVIIHNFKLVIKGTIKINKQIHLQKKPNKNKPNQTIKSLKKNYNLKNDERTFFFWKSLSCVWHFVTIYSPWNSPGLNTGVDGLFLLQGIFPTQGLNPGLPHCWWILYQLSHKGKPSILEWVAYPFSSRSSRPRNWTGVSWIAGGFFTNWAIRERS